MPNWEALFSEVRFETSRSSGPGGQHVNKTESKVVARLSITSSASLSDDEKRRLLAALSSKLTSRGEILVSASSARSQKSNKEKALKNLRSLLARGLIVKKKRIPTKPSPGAVEKRIKRKKGDSRTKALRGKRGLEE